MTFGSSGVVTDAPAPEPVLLTRFELQSPSPNPFREAAALNFALPAASPVHVRIFDASGALVRTVLRETLPAGLHAYTWDGRDDHGLEVVSGIHYLKMSAGKELATRKLVRMQ